MSAREWKPGDVAMLTIPGRHESFAMFMDGGEWETPYAEADGRTTYQPCTVIARPLAVIDPENAEQIGRLAEVWEAQTHATLSDTPMSLSQYRMQAALRILTAPLKPDEPTGTWAAVRDSDDRRWVRTDEQDRPWFCIDMAEADCDTVLGAFRGWPDIAAVKVLSEGVTP